MPTWDERYRSGEGRELKPDTLIVEIAATIAPGMALDLACGLGRNSIVLARAGWQVTAVDLSPTAVEAVAAHENVRPVRADLEAGEFVIERHSFDLIIDSLFLYRPLFPSIKAGLRGGGLFIGIFPTGGVREAYLISADELLAQFSGWEVIHLTNGARLALVCRKPTSTTADP